MEKTEICILGAGPGGAAAALKLSYLGIPCVLIDKARFPRDKVCGDAISGKVTTLLKRLDPAILERFLARAGQQTDVWGIRFVAPNGDPVDVPFRPGFDKTADPVPGFVSRRMDFDHFLVEEVRRRENIRFLEGVEISSIEKQAEGFRLRDKTGQTELDCRLLLAANGAYSAFTRHYAGLKKNPKHYAGAVRAYFKGVKDFHPDNFIELHFTKKLIPGYFWVFPLPEGGANVGLGMRSDIISKRRIDIKKLFWEVIETQPVLKERFLGAELEGKLEGYGLPLGSQKQRLSGDHFMLVGDAAHLIDPLSGEGIGNAVYSGFIAAEQAQQCLASGDFSARFLKAYDARIERVLGSEMKVSYMLQRMMRYPRLINFLARKTNRNKDLLYLISKMYNDTELRKKVWNPVFWVKVLSGAKVE